MCGSRNLFPRSFPRFVNQLIVLFMKKFGFGAFMSDKKSFDFGMLGEAAGGLGSLISGLFNIGSAGREWKYQQKQMALEQQYNEKNMAIQNQYAIDAFNRENAYNDPSAVRARYEAAGISPQAAFNSGGVVGQASTMQVPDVSSPTAKGKIEDSASRVGQALAQVGPQMALMGAQVEKMKADARKANAEAANQEWQNSELNPILKSIKENENTSSAARARVDVIEQTLREATADKDKETRLLAFDKVQAEIDKLKSDKSVNDQQIKNLQETLNVYREQIENLKADTDLKKKQSDYYSEQAELSRYQQKVEQRKSDLIDAQTSEARKRADLVDKEIDKIGKDMDLTEEQISDIKSRRALAWSKFGVDTALSVSQEAREWCYGWIPFRGKGK